VVNKLPVIVTDSGETLVTNGLVANPTILLLCLAEVSVEILMVDSNSGESASCEDSL
jgi:hypothetical protein